MRKWPPVRLGAARQVHPRLGESPSEAMWGWFILRLRGGATLRIMSSGPDAWEHVSVSAVQRGRVRIPTWEEMALVKSLFWDDEETVVQFHPKVAEYVNVHPQCLHLWKRADVDYELPPRELLA